MPGLLEILAREKRLFSQTRELQSLRGEVDRLRAENERIRTAMRRCLTCDYRLEVVGKSPGDGDA
ncbi:MAG: hypothetical protein JRH10_15780 [Deltaproteobacteria bacterium]|nr:hypothetical protein [Deltaproteobacteria bacterium]MBW2445502.1 hypothetical protein [Deltaproteobacteria bacterium]